MTLKFDEESGDIKLTDGKFEEVFGIEAVGQRVKDTLNTFRGEWFLDTEFGVPYLESILGQKTSNLATIGAILKSSIREAAGDDATLTSFQLTSDISTRVMKASFIIKDSADQIFEDDLIL